MKDYSQFGEFTQFLKPIFTFYGVRYGVLVDIGASGRDLSNSYNLIAEHGFQAILVEPVNFSRVEREIQSDFPALVAVDKSAVGQTEGTAKMFLHTVPEHHSLVSTWYPPTDGHKTQDVPTVRIGTLLKKWDLPWDFDYLTIDVEGLDIDLVQDMIDNTTYRPRVLLFEHLYATPQQVQTIKMNLHAAGYSIIFENNANIGLVLDEIQQAKPLSNTSRAYGNTFWTKHRIR